MRLPIEWQRIKEEAFAHPCLVAACLTGWPALHCLSLCLSILGGEVVSSWAFRFVLVHVLQWRTLTDAHGGDQSLTEEAKLAGNLWQLGLLGIATSIPPATVIGVISLMHLGGELSLRRAKLAFTGQLTATLWALCSVLLLIRLCSHWRYRTCKEVEKKDDFVCQDPVEAKVQRVLMSFACYFETTIECQVVFVILCCFGLCAVISLLGSIVGLYGVLQLQSVCGKFLSVKTKISSPWLMVKINTARTFKN